MSRTRVAILGLLSFLPIVLSLIILVYFMVVWKEMMVHMLQQPANPEQFMPEYFSAMFRFFIFIVPMLILHIGLIIYYIMHIIRHQQGTEQIVWIIVMLLAGSIGFPVYWIMNIRRAATPQQTQLPI